MKRMAHRQGEMKRMAHRQGEMKRMADRQSEKGDRDRDREYVLNEHM